MYISVTANNEPSLKDEDNFRAFSVIEEKAGIAIEQLAKISESTEDGHIWLDANAVVSMSDKSQDTAWVDQFWDMLAQVEKYGYSDISAKRVKAHIEQA